MALASYGFSVYDFAMALSQEGLASTVVDRDFANYWLGGRLALSGEYADLFNHDIYFAHLQALFGVDYQIRSWSYPPHYLLMVWPLGLLSYKAALLVYLGGTFLLFVAAAELFRRELAPKSDLRLLVLASIGYVLMVVSTSQNGFLTAAFLLSGLAWMKSRPVLAGLAFACLTVKPQLGLLIPVLIAFDRNWKVLLWSSVFAAMLVCVSVAVFGLHSWGAYFTDTLPYQRSILTDWEGSFLAMMPSVFGSLRTFGLSPAMAAGVQWPVSIGALLLVSWLLYRERDPLRRAFAVTCGTFLVSPYAFNYDMGALGVSAALLAGTQRRSDGAVSLVPIAVVACMPAVVSNLARGCAPLILLIGLAVMVASVRAVNALRAPGTPASAPIGS